MSFGPTHFQREVVTLPDAGAANFPAQGMARITVITGAGCTATVSRVDSSTASAHTTGTQNSFTVAPTTATITTVDWPYYRVSASGGSCRVGII